MKNCHSLARFSDSRLMLVTWQWYCLFSKRPAAEGEDFCFGCLHLSSSAHVVYQWVRTCILVPRVTLSSFFSKLCTVFEMNDVKWDLGPLLFAPLLVNHLLGFKCRFHIGIASNWNSTSRKCLQWRQQYPKDDSCRWWLTKFPPQTYHLRCLGDKRKKNK